MLIEIALFVAILLVGGAFSAVLSSPARHGG